MLTRSERLKQIREFFLYNLMEEGETPFNDNVIDTLNALEEKYHDPDIKRIIGVHTKCGGNIVAKAEHTWCDKCEKYFCGCACG